MSEDFLKGDFLNPHEMEPGKNDDPRLEKNIDPREKLKIIFEKQSLGQELSEREKAFIKMNEMVQSGLVDKLTFKTPERSPSEIDLDDYKETAFDKKPVHPTKELPIVESRDSSWPPAPKHTNWMKEWEDKQQ